MKTSTLINASADEIRDLIRRAVEDANGPLREEVKALKEKIHKARPVITHKEAPAYFAYNINSDTVIDYCNRKQDPIPHKKRGRTYFIRLEDLYAWQAGNYDSNERMASSVDESINPDK